MTTTEASAALAELGFSIEATTPIGKCEDKWPCIAYQCQVTLKGREVWAGEYKLGVGHVKLDSLKDPYSVYAYPGWSDNERAMLSSWRNNRNANFTDKHLQARVAAKLAVAQKVKPDLAGVMHSLISDGSAYFDGLTFEQWAVELGCDPDSRKAEAIFKDCDETGRKLKGSMHPDTLAKVREILQDY